MTLEGSNWAQNVPTNHHKRDDSTDLPVQSVAHAPHCKRGKVESFDSVCVGEKVESFRERV